MKKVTKTLPVPKLKFSTSCLDLHFAMVESVIPSRTLIRIPAALKRLGFCAGTDFRGVHYFSIVSTFHHVTSREGMRMSIQ